MAENNDDAEQRYLLVKLSLGACWCVLCVVGWLLANQVSGVMGKVEKLDISASQIAVAIGELKVRSEANTDIVQRLETNDRAYGDKLSKIEVFVNELIEIRREERRDAAATIRTNPRAIP